MSTTETVTKQRVLVETRVIVEPGYIPYWERKTEEARHRYLKDWAERLMEFLRDHRCQDVNAVYADPTYQDQCSRCHCQWETMIMDNGQVCCAGCGAPVETVKEST